MGRKYLMFIDEDGFTDKNNNFYMLGVIFDEEDYLKRNTDNALNIDNFQLENLKFNVVMSTVNYENEFNINTIVNAFKKLLYNYYCFLVENSGENSGLAVEWRKGLCNSEKGQTIFNLYMDRDTISELNDCRTLINRFMIIDDTFIEYKSFSEIYNIIRKSIVYNCNKPEGDAEECKYNDIINERIMETIKNRFFIEEIAFDIYGKDSVSQYMKLKTMEQKITNLEEELKKKR